MITYTYEIKSSKGILLKQLYQEIKMIVKSYEIEQVISKTKRARSINSVFLITSNLKLISALKKDTDYILEKIKQ